MATHFHTVHGIDFLLGPDQIGKSFGEGCGQREYLVIGGFRLTGSPIFGLDTQNLFDDLLAFGDLEIDIGIRVHPENLRGVFIWELLDVVFVVLQRAHFWGVVDSGRRESVFVF